MKKIKKILFGIIMVGGAMFIFNPLSTQASSEDSRIGGCGLKKECIIGDGCKDKKGGCCIGSASC